MTPPADCQDESAITGAGRTLEPLIAALARQGIEPRYVMDRLHRLFAGVELRGKTILDVGSGNAFASVYAAMCGAAAVVALEPELDGSSPAMVTTSRRLVDELNLGPRVRLSAARLEEFDRRSTFDLVLVKDAINHFDRDACRRLATDPAARKIYAGYIDRLAAHCRGGGHLIITDCSNRNFFPDFGLRHPLMKTINWQIHQPPEVWIELFAQAGFGRPRVSWTPLTGMGWFGRVFGTKRFLAYFINSEFRLVMRRKPYA